MSEMRRRIDLVLEGGRNFRDDISGMRNHAIRECMSGRISTAWCIDCAGNEVVVVGSSRYGGVRCYEVLRSGYPDEREILGAIEEGLDTSLFDGFVGDEAWSPRTGDFSSLCDERGGPMTERTLHILAEEFVADMDADARASIAQGMGDADRSELRRMIARANVSAEHTPDVEDRIVRFCRETIEGGAE